MRILALVSDAFGGHGGIAKFNRDLLSALCGADGVEKVVAVPRLVPEPPGRLPEKLEFVTEGVGGKIRFARAVLKQARATAKPQLILCGHINLLPVAFLARFFCGAPVALVIHGIDAWLPTPSRLVNRLAGKVDAVIAVSHFTQKNFLTWAEPKHAQKFILPNCVDLAQFTPGPKNPALLERYGLSGKTVLLTVARLSSAERYKGVDEMLEVLPELVRQVPEIVYLIAGDGTDRVRLEEKAASLGLRGRAIFAGKVANAELVDHFRLADAFVMPGRGEGFGIVYLEALACGVPVLASEVDASGEVVAGCTQAVAVDPDLPDELLAGIRQVLSLPRGVVTDWVRQFSTERFNRRCQEIFAALAAGGK
jgi:glycosyltransferase involved in cell wall biosynthesis